MTKQDDELSSHKDSRAQTADSSAFQFLKAYKFPPDGNVREDILERYGYDGDLLDIYVDGAPQLVHKWHHYLPIYDRYFNPWRSKPVRFLELGVSKGGSLSMWRRYFGKDAIIFGIDTDEDCRTYDGIDGQVRIGSQADPDFLASVVEEMGGGRHCTR
jgi:hypothetical protein